MDTARTAGVIVDLDGTLLDSVYLHVLAWVRALRETGYDDVTMEEVHRAFGMSPDSLVKELTGATDQRVLDAYDVALTPLRKDIWPFTEAPELLRYFRDAGLTVVVVTHATAEALQLSLDLLDADDAIDGTICNDDLDPFDNEPNLVRAALDRFQLCPDRSLMIGDARWDMEASVLAGVRAVGLTSGGNASSLLYNSGAHDVFEDPADLLGYLNSPYGERVPQGLWKLPLQPPRTA